MNATHRWNIKSGATRSGKTYMDYFVIPKRIRNCTGRGLIVLIGNTQGTLIRNVVDPMRNIWGDQLIRLPNTNTGTIQLFGKKCYMLGADNKASVKKLQGSAVEYAYGDEITTWNEEMFSMLKSRLDKPTSIFDGTCNPEAPGHWLKKFIDSDADIYNQSYCLDDNPFNSKEFVDNLKKELAGTVYYDRFVYGRWVAAEGVIYQMFANAPEKFYINQEDLPYFESVNIGVDFGGNKSKHAFVATGLTTDGKIIALKSKSVSAKDGDVDKLLYEFIIFSDEINAKYGIDTVYCDSAEQVLKNTIKNRTGYTVRDSIKNPIIDRIRCTALLMATGRFFLLRGANDDLVKGLSDALWKNENTKDIRLDDGTTDIDILDAYEYSFERYMRQLTAIEG
ncbi:MAG: PBSX family phage terminase large subunit [Oscillospiraceae bacterium]|nr:PBSX family phage terminase large subunit [Oscillospiraceae bacterium]